MPPGGIYRAGQAIVPGWREGIEEGGRKKGKEEREEGKEMEIKGGES